MSAFAKFAWFALAYNVLVIVWGVFLRASKSGDGCGQFWLTCNGELIPSAPQFKTVIEFSHRMTTAVDGIVMLALLAWAVRRWYTTRTVQNRQIVFAAIGSAFFVFTEAAVGAGLVLTGNTAEAITDTRPLWAIGHLVNTFILLTFLTLTAWLATGSRRVDFRAGAKVWILIILAVAGLLLVGSSGALAALSNMLFPSQSISEGIAKDFSPASNLVLRLRLSHPVVSIMTGVYILFIAGWLKATVPDDAKTAWWSKVVSIIVTVQVAFGGATLLTLGPIVMQLGHLLLADMLWIAFVLLVANFLAARARSLP